MPGSGWIGSFAACVSPCETCTDALGHTCADRRKDPRRENNKPHPHVCPSASVLVCVRTHASLTMHTCASCMVIHTRSETQAHPQGSAPTAALCHHLLPLLVRANLAAVRRSTARLSRNSSISARWRNQLPVRLMLGDGESSQVTGHKSR